MCDVLLYEGSESEIESEMRESKKGNRKSRENYKLPERTEVEYRRVNSQKTLPDSFDIS